MIRKQHLFLVVAAVWAGALFFVVSARAANPRITDVNFSRDDDGNYISFTLRDFATAQDTRLLRYIMIWFDQNPLILSVANRGTGLVSNWAGGGCPSQGIVAGNGGREVGGTGFDNYVFPGYVTPAWQFSPPVFNPAVGAYNYKVYFTATCPNSGRDKNGRDLTANLSPDDYVTVGLWYYDTFFGFMRDDLSVSDGEHYYFKPAEQLKEPVIVVPGITGTRLNRSSDNEEVWPNVVKMLDPLHSDDAYLDDLILNDNGEQVISINPSGIIKSVGPLMGYGALLDKFKNDGYIEGKNLYALAYDWRLDIKSQTERLDEIMRKAVNNSPTGKVNIVAHSMGGLLAENYLSKPGKADLIHKIIFAGTPRLGAPKAFKILNYGDDLDYKKFGLGLNDQEVKKISQNMPAIYQLLPSRAYLDAAGGYMLDFSQKPQALSYDETNEWMQARGRNVLLMDTADNFHEQADGQSIAGPNIYNIIGCQDYATVGQFRLYGNNKMDITTVNGDGTVPLLSARHNTQNAHDFYALYSKLSADHTDLIRNPDLINFIAGIVEGQDASFPQGISQNVSDCLNKPSSPNRILFSTHSPVELHIYDENGRHTGPDINGDIELGIPQSEYMQLGENNFAFVPAGGRYRVVISAYSTGSFDFKVRSLADDAVVETQTYLTVPILDKRLTAEFNAESSELAVDANGDGVVDETLNPTSDWTGSDNDITPPVLAWNQPAQYAHDQNITALFDAQDESGIALTQAHFDGKTVTGGQVDLFFEKLGSHALDLTAYDRLGNPAFMHVPVLVTATLQSTLADIQRAYNLGWIANNGGKNSLMQKLQNWQKTGNNSLVLNAFLDELESMYNKGVVNKRAYDLLKADITWLNL